MSKVGMWAGALCTAAWGERAEERMHVPDHCSRAMQVNRIGIAPVRWDRIAVEQNTHLTRDEQIVKRVARWLVAAGSPSGGAPEARCPAEQPALRCLLGPELSYTIIY